MIVAMFAVLFALLATTNAVEWVDHEEYEATQSRSPKELNNLGAGLSSVLQLHTPYSRPKLPKVACPAGTFIGRWDKSQFGWPIKSFEGIRYAHAPRFQLARAVERFQGETQATKPGPRCIQRRTYGRNSSLHDEGDEDCLYLNVYVPEVKGSDGQLPVMVFIHGGGFVIGVGSIHKSNYLLDQDIVLVTLNYRLGPLGFLTTEDDVIPANLGLKDQVEALRWVKKNIASFGGDPDLVTVFGQSAGSVSSDFLMASPLTQKENLLHRVIAMSGSSFAPWGLARPGEMSTNVEKAAGQLGCPTGSSEDLLACLMEKTPEEITAVDMKFDETHYHQTQVIMFKPVVEGNVPGAHITHYPEETLFNEIRLANDVPYMTGFTSQEGTFFLTIGESTIEPVLEGLNKNFTEYSSAMLLLSPEEKEHNAVLRRAYVSTVHPDRLTKKNIQEVANMFTDLFIIWPSLKSQRLHRIGTNSPGYAYYFDYRGTHTILSKRGFDNSDGDYGVTHCDDLFYLFPLFPELQPSLEDIRMTTILTELFTSFALNGIPSSPSMKTKWRPVTTKGNDIEYLRIKSPDDITMQQNLLPERWGLLEKLFDSDKWRHEVWGMKPEGRPAKRRKTEHPSTAD